MASSCNAHMLAYERCWWCPRISRWQPAHRRKPVLERDSVLEQLHRFLDDVCALPRVIR
jgi:hypothetical protein